ncbi:MAG: response regulator, partial [candidate division Zixibacteria bacterium]|nr:response regulator [candidate division Zixibacteria bacterium]NIS45947.1 response regulator [candidate division Zixibacteria bacterium]NIU14079.1 response regulator [candidate division Zixibacteria bacterium]NIV06112.1 response regulator [candidate division Zixibacteria bacterium]NIW44896.1 response regulator [Gammaproteobacteria bacterium]
MTESLSLNLMLVEDDKDFAFLLQNHLSNAISTQTWQFTHVTTLKEALNQGLNRYFHAILLDLGLPDSRGLSTLKHILNNYPNTPVVVFSAVQNEDQALRAVQMGAQDYIVKGQVDNAQLGRAIRFAIERHHARTELQRLAMIDDLTKLYNRRAFNALSEQQLKLADREGKSLLLLLIDMDGLKAINDT